MRLSALIRFAYSRSSAILSEHTFLINVTNYSVLRLDWLAICYFDLCWLLDIRCYCPCGLPRPHGISHTSFLVFSPDLRIKVTVAFGILLPFASSSAWYASVSDFCPSRHDFAIASSLSSVTAWNLQVAPGFVGNYATWGLSPQMHDMPVIKIKRDFSTKSLFRSSIGIIF